MAQPHLPLDALLARTGLDRAITAAHNNSSGEWWVPGGQTLLAEHLGKPVRTIARWLKDGIPLRSAEDACDVFGLHPYEVWPIEYLEACDA